MRLTCCGAHLLSIGETVDDFSQRRINLVILWQTRVGSFERVVELYLATANIVDESLELEEGRVDGDVIEVVCETMQRRVNLELNRRRPSYGVGHVAHDVAEVKSMHRWDSMGQVCCRVDLAGGGRRVDGGESRRKEVWEKANMTASAAMTAAAEYGPSRCKEAEVAGIAGDRLLPLGDAGVVDGWPDRLTRRARLAFW